MTARSQRIRTLIGIIALLLFPSSARAAELSHSPLVKIAGGFGFLEGPVWNTKEQALYFSDMRSGTIHRWKPGAAPEFFLKTDPAPNGLAFDAGGRLVYCQPGGKRIVATGPEEILAEDIGGRPLAPPNDIWAGPQAHFFTIPDRRKKDPEFAAGTFIQGAIAAIPTGGKPLVVSGKLALRSPNGITGSPDGEHLFYTNAGKVWRAEIGPDLILSEPKIVALTGWDGLALDGKGNVYTTSEKGVAIYSPSAELLLDIPVPEKTANFCFGGAEGKTLFITARTGLYSTEIDKKKRASSR